MINITDLAKCCGCEACVQICSHNAIKMQPDAHGVLYPIVDIDKCVDCGLCDRVCHMQRQTSDDSLGEPCVYAVKNKNKAVLVDSASGGAFSALAQWMFDKGGRVYGSMWDENISPKHCGIDGMNSLVKLQGSKYVQSRIGDTYKDVEKDLKIGIPVLFSGTPCQCAGLRSYLRKEYDLLYCVELVCHGVPSAKFLRDYLDILEKKYGGKIINLKFRDKRRDWGALLSITYKTSKNIIKTAYLSTAESYYYYYYYWGGILYRDSCYSCKYAKEKRESDFTIGDFWGVNKFHPEISTKDGVSLLIANTEKAKDSCEDLSQYMEMTLSKLSYAQEQNGQLKSPSKHNHAFDFIWDIYETKGAQGVYDNYKSTHRKQILLGYIKRHIPLGVKRYVKKMM